MGKDALLTVMNDSPGQWIGRVLSSISSSYTFFYDSTDSVYRAECNKRGGTDYDNADAATTLQWILDSGLPDAGGKIHIKAGSYPIATTITIPRVGATDHCKPVFFQGEGYPEDAYWTLSNFGTVLKGSSLAGDMFTTNSSVYSFLGMEKLTIVGTVAGMGASQTSGNLIHPYNLQEGWFRDVEVCGAFADGIKVENSGAYDSDNVIVDQCRIEDCGGYGVDFLKVIYGKIDNSHVENCANGIFTSTTSDQVHISSCSVLGNTGEGINASGIENIVYANMVNSNGQEGIFVGGSRCIIANNTVIANGTSATDPYGIRPYNVTDCTVMGNVCTDTQGSKTQTYGIYEEGTSDYNIFIGNVLRGNATGGINIVGANSVNQHNIT